MWLNVVKGPCFGSSLRSPKTVCHPSPFHAHYKTETEEGVTSKWSIIWETLMFPSVDFSLLVGGCPPSWFWCFGREPQGVENCKQKASNMLTPVRSLWSILNSSITHKDEFTRHCSTRSYDVGGNGPLLFIFPWRFLCLWIRVDVCVSVVCLSCPCLSVALFKTAILSNLGGHRGRQGYAVHRL